VPTSIRLAWCFTKCSRAKFRNQRLDQRFEAPSRKVQVDVRIDEVVLRALEKSPALRWQTRGGNADAGRNDCVGSERRRCSGGVEATERSWTHCCSVLCRRRFAWFVLVGHRSFGIDLDAGRPALASLIGFPLIAGAGRVAGVGTWRLRSDSRFHRSKARMVWRCLHCRDALALSVGLMGGGMAIGSLHLKRQSLESCTQ
jgi:hypothetical protein